MQVRMEKLAQPLQAPGNIFVNTPAIIAVTSSIRPEQGGTQHTDRRAFPGGGSA